MTTAKTAEKTEKVVKIDVDLNASKEEIKKKFAGAAEAARQIDSEHDDLLMKQPKRHQEVVSVSLTEFVTLLHHVLGMDLQDGQKASITLKVDRKAKASDDGEIENTVGMELTWDVPPVDKKTAWTLDSLKTVKRRSFRFRCDATGNHVLEDLPLFAELAFADTGEVKPEAVQG